MKIEEFPIDRAERSLAAVEAEIARIEANFAEVNQLIRSLREVSADKPTAPSPLLRAPSVTPQSWVNVTSEESEHALVAGSGLFDSQYYLKTYPDVGAVGIDPLVHYMVAGYLEGRNPNKFFETDWYRALYPEVDGNPLVHYIVHGHKENRSTSQAFNGAYYAQENPDVFAAGLNPLKHFIDYGRSEGRSATRLRLEDLRPLAPPSLAWSFERLDPYESWMAANAPTASSRQELTTALKEREGRLPRISLITPVYNTPPELLRELVASVRAQIYQDWELCIVDDCSPSSHVRPLLQEIAASDPRIKVRSLQANGGISVATNEAVSHASGEVVAFLDHDDLITEDCLGELAIYYCDHPEADVVYSDDDKIDIAGKRFAPQFKPDWAPTLLLSYMYLGHIFTVRRSLFVELGGFLKEYDGSQDYEFALRVVEKARHVGHVPKILYHWRVVPGSTAASGDAKPASMEAGRRAVEATVRRRGLRVSAVKHPDWAQAGKCGMFALEFPDDGPTVTIIVPTFNRVDLLTACIESLQKTTYRNFDVLVVDNESTDAATLRYLAELNQRPQHRVVRIGNDGRFSYAALMNKAVKRATGEYILFLNNDTEVIQPRWLTQMMGYAQMPKVGSVGARLYFGDRTLQHAGIVHGFHGGLAGHAFRCKPPHDWGYLGYVRVAREYSAVTAACAVTPRWLFESLGGFDASNFAVAYNDADYGYRLTRLGYSNVYCPEAELFHYEGKTRGFLDNPREVAAYRRIHSNTRDRFFNPNLSLTDESFVPTQVRVNLRPRQLPDTAVVSHNLNFEGAPLVLLDLVSGLIASSSPERVTVYSPVEGPLRKRFEALGVEVRIIDDPKAGVTTASVYEERCTVLGEMLRHAGHEVVIANTLSMFWAINAATSARLPSVWCNHESEPWETYYDYLVVPMRAYAYAAFAQAYRVTYVAEATRAVWEPVETRSNFEVVRYGIPASVLDREIATRPRSAARLELGVSEDDLVIALVGTVCQRKNQLDLVDAFAELPVGLQKRLKIFIVGSIGEEEYLEKINARLAELQPEIRQRMELTGAKEGALMYFAAADIAVCTSRVESAPRILLEAMAFGLPIVTTPVYGVPELVKRDVNALFYQPGDVRSLASEIERLASDERLRHKLASNSRSVLESLPGYEAMIMRYRALLTEAVISRVVMGPS
jgi:O-antigen biosynthesis protein